MARKYENVLGRYRTYSYHHALVACSNTAIAEQLGKSSKLETFVDRSSVRFRKKRLKGYESIGEYVILINGRSDVRFSIENLRVDSLITNPKSKGGITATAISGSMTIKEPFNLGGFLNVIKQASDELQVGFTGLVFLLKTFFVGHTNDGRTEWINLKPLMIYFTDVKANFDTAGSEYDIEFVSYSNGVAKLDQFSNILQYVPSITLTQKKSTLFDAILDLEIKLNEEYEKFYTKFKQDLSSQGKDLEGKKIYYNIQLDPVYYSSDYRIDLVKPQNTDKIDSGVQIPLNVNTIEGAITTILQKCSKLVEEGIAKEGFNEPLYGYKIFSTVETTNDEARVTYYVSRHQLPVGNSKTQQVINYDENDIIEMDYIFTGKNVYIRDLQLRMNMGLSFLQTVTTTEQLPDTEAKRPVNKPTTSGFGSQYGQNKQDIIFVPKKQTEKQARNVKKVNTVSNFQEMLSRFAALETIEISLTMLGDPLLYNDLAVSKEELLELINREDPPSAKFKWFLVNWTKIPPLLKINIRKPVEPTREGQRRFEDFWYKGAYHILKVQSVFEEGRFLQTLHLLAVPAQPVLTTTQEVKEENV